jgi:putative component of toxin-antitoxin plasmid stabilization module
LIILLAGGGKATQEKVVRKAIDLARSYKEDER